MNSRIVFCGLFLFLLCSQTGLVAKERKTLTLDETIHYAREYSASALIARHTFLTAYWRYRSYRAEFLPSLRLEGQVPSFSRRLTRYQLSDGSYKYIRENANTFTGALSLTQRIGFTGTSIFLRSTAERHDLFGDRRTTDYVTTPVQVGLEHDFFALNSLKWKKKIEPKRYQEAQRIYLQTMEEVAQDATTHFFDLLLAQQNLAIARLNRANADTLYHIAKGRFNIGTIAENDLLQMELNLLNATNAENDGEVSLQNAQFQLITFLGLNDDYDWDLIAPLPYRSDTLTFGQMLAFAHQNNPTPLRLEIENTESEQNVAEAQSQRGFQANLRASYGLTQQAQRFPDAYRSPLDQQGVSLQIVVPILDWGQGSGRVKMARSLQELTRVRSQKTLHSFEQQIFLEVMRYNRQPQLLLLASKADTIAQNRFNIAKQRFLIGKISVLDLDKAQVDRDDARIRYLEAVRSSWLTYYKLRALTLVDPRNASPLPIDIEKLLR